MKDDPESTLARSFRQSLLYAEAEAPSFDQVADYVDGRLTGEARVLFEERLREDALLQAEVSDLQDLRIEMAGRRATAPIPAWTYLAAAAVIAAAVAGFLLTRGPHETQVATAPVAGVPPTAGAGEPAIVAGVQDGTGAIELRADGTLRGGAQIPPSVAPSVVRALREGVLAIPALRADLAVAPVAAMGRAGAGSRFAPVGPLSTIVLSDRPTLRWSAHPRARSYEASVFDLDLEPVASSGAVAATEWTPPAALRRGRTYLWQVRATTADGPETVPAPPAAEARFHVASAAAVAALQPALASGSDLAAGVALAEAGFLEEAARRFDALAAENVGSPEIRRLRGALAAARKR